jgi:hypothetical protein
MTGIGGRRPSRRSSRFLLRVGDFDEVYARMIARTSLSSSTRAMSHTDESPCSSTSTATDGTCSVRRSRATRPRHRYSLTNCYPPFSAPAGSRDTAAVGAGEQLRGVKRSVPIGGRHVAVTRPPDAALLSAFLRRSTSSNLTPRRCRSGARSRRGRPHYECRAERCGRAR